MKPIRLIRRFLRLMLFSTAYVTERLFRLDFLRDLDLFIREKCCLLYMILLIFTKRILQFLRPLKQYIEELSNWRRMFE